MDDSYWEKMMKNSWKMSEKLKTFKVLSHFAVGCAHNMFNKVAQKLLTWLIRMDCATNLDHDVIKGLFPLGRTVFETAIYVRLSRG